MSERSRRLSEQLTAANVLIEECKAKLALFLDHKAGPSILEELFISIMKYRGSGPEGGIRLWWDGTEATRVKLAALGCRMTFEYGICAGDVDVLNVKTVDGELVRVAVGDWICRDDAGNFWIEKG